MLPGDKGPGTVVSAEPVATAEAVADGKKDEKKPDDKLAGRFAALAKQSDAVREREAVVAAKEKNYAGFDKLRATAAEQPLEALRILGIDPKVVIRALAGKKPTADEEIASVKQKLADRDKSDSDAKLKADADAREAQITAATERYKGEIASVVAEKPAEYELIGMEGERGVALVYRTADLHFKKTGVILKPEEAAALVEAHLVEDARKKSGAKKLQPVAPEPATAPAPATAGKSGQPKKAAAKAPEAGQPATITDDEDAAPKSPRSRRQQFEEITRDPKFRSGKSP